MAAGSQNCSLSAVSSGMGLAFPRAGVMLRALQRRRRRRGLELVRRPINLRKMSEVNDLIPNKRLLVIKERISFWIHQNA